MRFILVLLAIPLLAQWPAMKAPGIPRLADGRPDLNAPAPKLADGKPDLSGLWNPPGGFIRDLANGLPANAVAMRPWAREVYQVRATGALAHLEPDANCLPQGTPKINIAPAPWKLLQMPNQIAILYEAFTQWRQIFTDGRAFPKDPNPTWFGYSVGRWEGDTLVVESIGFNGRVWLDQSGHPSTEQMRVTERFRRVDFGHLEVSMTIDDPGAYEKPWTSVARMTLQPDNELMEFICLENEKDIQHLQPK